MTATTTPCPSSACVRGAQRVPLATARALLCPWPASSYTSARRACVVAVAVLASRMSDAVEDLHNAATAST